MTTLTLTDLNQTPQAPAKSLYRLGGLAALGLGGLFILLLIVLAGILPAQGFGPGALNDPAIGIRFLSTSIWPSVIASIYLGVAVTFALMALVVAEWLETRGASFTQIIKFIGLAAGTLFLAYAMINIISSASIVSAYQHDPALGSALYLAARIIGNGLNSAALFAAGLATTLIGWAGIKTQAFSRFLGAILIIAGICTTLSFVVLPLGLLGVLLAPVWAIWLGVVILKTAH